MAHTNGIKNMQASLKHELAETYHTVRTKCSLRYLDELLFKLNDKNCKIDTMYHIQLLVRDFGGKKVNYKGLTNG